MCVRGQEGVFVVKRCVLRVKRCGFEVKKCVSEQEGGKKKYCTSRVFFGLDPLLTPYPPTPPLQCPHPNKRGTNLLLFKFCIHLHTKVGEIQSP